MDIGQKVKVIKGAEAGRTGIIVKVFNIPSNLPPTGQAETLVECVDMKKETDSIITKYKVEFNDGTSELYSADCLEVIDE